LWELLCSVLKLIFTELLSHFLLLLFWTIAFDMDWSEWGQTHTHTKVNKETNWLPCVEECAWDSHCHRSNKVRALNTRELIWNVQLFNFRRLSEWKEIDLKRWKYEFKGIQIKLQIARLLKDSQNVSVWFETANEHLLR